MKILRIFSNLKYENIRATVVSLTAVFSLVTQRGKERCVTRLKTAARETWATAAINKYAVDNLKRERQWYCRFSLSHHHQNHSTNKVKNQRGKRRWIFKQWRKDSGLCNVSCGRYSKKCFTEIYNSMYGDAMFVSLWGTQIWRPEANKNICHRVFYKEPVVVF